MERKFARLWWRRAHSIAAARFARMNPMSICRFWRWMKSQPQSFAGLRQFELVQINFQPEEKILSPEDLLGFRPSFEVVGDIAMVEDSDAERVAAALMSTSKSIKTVIAPISDVEGEFRTRRFRHVAGEARTVTLHKEHGLRYRVDLEGAYFTPRLGTERLRIAGLVSPG